MSSKGWVPEICYEDAEDGITSAIPFVPVPQHEKMPELLYIFESRDTGEFEPGSDGEDLPVTEMELHQFADMAILKESLSPDLYDQVRLVLGLEPMHIAASKGAKISKNVRDNVEKM